MQGTWRYELLLLKSSSKNKARLHIDGVLLKAVPF